MVATICSTGALAAAAAAAAGIGSASAASGTATASSVGHLCRLVSAELMSVNVSSPCGKTRTVTVVSNTPLGPVRVVQYSTEAASGLHSLRIVVQNPQVPAGEQAAAQQYLRGLVLANGALFSGKPLASDFLDTISCTNPNRTSDCTTGHIEAVVGPYFVQIFLHDTAPFIRPDNPQKPTVDDTNDRDQEDTVKQSFEAIGRSVIAGV